MRDCENVEMRDRLPDLLNGSLAPGEAAAVSAHVAECDACGDEYGLLRDMRSALVATTPRIDIGAIVDRIPTGAGYALPPRARSRWSANGWRMAAAASIVAVVGAVTVARSGMVGSDAGPSATRAVAVAPRAASPAPSPVARPQAPNGMSTTSEAPAPVTRVASTATQREGAGELPLHGGFSDLTDGQLQSLLSDLDKLDAVPPADVDPDAAGSTITDGGGL